MGHPAVFIILVIILVLVGGMMIQAGITSLSGDGGGGIRGFNLLTLTPESIGVPQARVRTPRGSSSGSTNTENTSKQKQVDFPEWVKGNGVSPYYGEVRMTSVRAGSFTRQGRVVIKSSYEGGERVNVTGWQIKAKNGGIFVPQAAERYLPGGISPNGDIRLDDGDSVALYTTASPVGQNMRINKCMGYLEEETDFDPSIPKRCPKPDLDVVRAYTSQCIDYTRTISTCETPESNPPVPFTDWRCREYLKKFTYTGCYNDHFSDDDFFLSEWRVWVGAPFLDQRHDRVVLLDREGRVVDYDEY